MRGIEPCADALNSSAAMIPGRMSRSGLDWSENKTHVSRFVPAYKAYHHVDQALSTVPEFELNHREIKPVFHNIQPTSVHGISLVRSSNKLFTNVGWSFSHPCSVSPVVRKRLRGRLTTGRKISRAGEREDDPQLRIQIRGNLVCV